MRLIIYIILVSYSIILFSCSDYSSHNSSNKIIVHYYKNDYKKIFNQSEPKNSDTALESVSSNQNSKNNVIFFGRIPFDDVREMYRQHQPLLNYLNQKLNKKVELKFYSSYSKMIDGIIAGEVQIAWMGPVSYVIAFEKIKNTNKLFIPLVKPQRRNSSYFQCDIITRKDSNIKSLKDLSNKSFAFLDTKSSAGFVLPFATLENAGVKINFNENNFLQHFGNIVKAVYIGKFDAGATFEEAYKNYLTPAEQKDIVVIAKSETIPFEPICFIQDKNNNLDEYKHLQKIFLEISQNDILNNLDMQKFLPANIEEYVRLTNLIKKVLEKNEKIFE